MKKNDDDRSNKKGTPKRASFFRFLNYTSAYSIYDMMLAVF